MEDEGLIGLRRLTGQYEHSIYQAVKAGQISQLSGESLSIAQAMQEHVHLRHVHNALEFADLREGQRYEIEHQGNAVSPLAHIYLHAAVKQSVKLNAESRLAFEKLVSEGISKHHAEHILSMLISEALWQNAYGGDPESVQKSLKKLDASRKVRSNWVRKTSDAHAWAE